MTPKTRKRTDKPDEEKQINVRLVGEELRRFYELKRLYLEKRQDRSNAEIIKELIEAEYARKFPSHENTLQE
jgi:hypothetical protein